MKKLYLLAFIAMLSLTFSCGNTPPSIESTKENQSRPNYVIELFNNEGLIIRSWESDNYVYESEGFIYFDTFGDNKRIKVSGTVIATEILYDKNFERITK